LFTRELFCVFKRTGAVVDLTSAERRFMERKRRVRTEAVAAAAAADEKVFVCDS
jgi:hypothetical protein